MTVNVSSQGVPRLISIAPVQLSAVQPKRPASENAKAFRSKIRAPSEQAQPTGLHLLFIEDDERVLYSVGRLLESKGFHVDPAADGEVGLGRALGGEYDVILLDLLLPRRSGIDVLRQLRTAGVWTPVVILTGRGNFESALEAGGLGVAAYFQKPPLLPDLTTALRTAAESARARRSRPSTLFSISAAKASTSTVTLRLAIEARPAIERDHLARLLANTACASDLTFQEFMATAKALQFLYSKPDLVLSSAVPKVQGWIESASRRGSSSAESRLGQVLARLSKAGKDWSKLSEQVIAADLETDSTRLWQSLSEEFGVTLIRCRRAVLMRKAALELLNGNEHVRQIAYRLGYTDAGNLDHDFRSFFGVTPTFFRRLQ
jgi:DNA-binding response OmpR family regulator